MFIAAILFVIAVCVFALMRIALRKRKLSVEMFFTLYLVALFGIALLALSVTGRLHWLFGLVGGLLPFASNILRWGGRIWATAAFFKRIRGAADSAKQHAPNTSSTMSRREALEVLGLEDGASDEDIKQAHRRMIQKLHPDHGGSSFLAARVNDAKERLLG